MKTKRETKRDRIMRHKREMVKRKEDREAERRRDQDRYEWHPWLRVDAQGRLF